jgi:hypothetical protein
LRPGWCDALVVTCAKKSWGIWVKTLLLILCLAKPGFHPLLTAHVLSADGVATLGEVPQARVDPRTITLPVVDGKGIHFTRLSTEDGLSQTRVPQIVQDDQGFMWFGSEYGLNRTMATRGAIRLSRRLQPLQPAVASFCRETL